MSEDGIFKIIGYFAAGISALFAVLVTASLRADRRAADRISALEREVVAAHGDASLRAQASTAILEALHESAQQLEAVACQVTAQDEKYAAAFREIARHIEDVKALVRRSGDAP